MSQAVSAPITGALAFTDGKSVKATDDPAEIAGQESPSRRAVLAGMMLAPAAAALPIAAKAAVQSENWTHPIDLTHRVDAPFWAALRNWRRVNQDWKRAIGSYPEGAPDDDMDDWGEREGAAEWAMLSTPIRTMRALAAKIEHIRSQELEVFAMREGGMICIMDLLAQDTHRMLFRDYSK